MSDSYDGDVTGGTGDYSPMASYAREAPETDFDQRLDEIKAELAALYAQSEIILRQLKALADLVRMTA